MLKKGRAPDYRDRDYGIQRRPEPIITRSRLEILTSVVKRFLSDRERARAALREVHDERLYETRYGTFENYCRDELQIGRTHAYRLLEAENVRESIGMSPLETEKLNENAARALKTVPPTERTEVVKEVARTGPVTAKRIAQVVASRKPPPTTIDAEVVPSQPNLKREKHCPTCQCGVKTE